jgi:hypothetical protein
MGYAAIVFTDNKVVNRGTQNLFGCVVKACGASVCGNVFDVYKVGMYLAGACGCLVRDNVFNTVADTSSLMFDDTGRNPVSNVVMNNVFSSEHASTVAVNFQDLTDVFNNYIDYNWFETSSVRFNNTTYASLAAAEAAQSAYTTRGGDALQDHCVFGQEAAVQVGASYRPGNGRAYLDAHPAVGGQAQAFGPFQQKRRTSKWLLLPT